MPRLPKEGLIPTKRARSDHSYGRNQDRQRDHGACSTDKQVYSRPHKWFLTFRVHNQLQLRTIMTSTISARAAVLRSSDAPFRIERVNIEAPRSDEVLVRLAATGICHTDMVMRDQALPTPLPVVLGHEGAGIVEAVGADVTHVRPGDHEVLAFNSCGHCASCDDHAPAYCVEFAPRNFMGSRPDGTSPLSGEGGLIHANIFGQSSFATHAIARDRNTVKVSSDAPLERLGPLGCGIMTGAGAVMNALRVRAGSTIAIFGTGAVGLSAIMAAKAVGAATIIAIDINESRLDLARELGATHTTSQLVRISQPPSRRRAQRPSTMQSIPRGARAPSAPPPTHSVRAAYWAWSGLVRRAPSSASTPPRSWAADAWRAASLRAMPIPMSSFPNWSRCTPKGGSPLIDSSGTTRSRTSMRRCQMASRGGR